MKATSTPSTNESRRGRQPIEQGAANGKPRSAKSGSTRTATAGNAIHNDVGGAPGEFAPDDELEHAGDREERDQELEPVSAATAESGRGRT